MKPFADYLMTMNPRYEFVVRVAKCDINEDQRNSIQSGLSMYVVKNFGAAKRLPVKEHADFVGLGPCEVHVMEVTLKYPTITDQLRQIVAERLGISASQVVVRTRREDEAHEAAPVEPKKKSGSILANPELEAESGQDLVGQNRIDSMLKELQSRRQEFAAKTDMAKPVNMPQNTKSPVGSTQNKIPSPKGK